MSHATIILGMPRSGTSMLTEILACNGLNLGSKLNLLGPDKNNSRGYFEYKPILNFNEKVLESIGSSLYKPPTRFINDEKFIKEGIEVWQEARSNGINLFKDPRFTILNSVWENIWLSTGETVLKIAIVRNPREVALSLKRMHNIPVMLGEKLWNIYNSRIINQLRLSKNNLIYHHELISQNHTLQNKKLANLLKINNLNFGSIDRSLIRNNSTDGPSDLNSKLIWKAMINKDNDSLLDVYEESVSDLNEVVNLWEFQSQNVENMIEIKTLRKAVVEQNEKITAQNIDVEVLRDELTSIKNSRIWRFTKLYRSFRNYIRMALRTD